MEFITKITNQIPGTVSEQLKADPALQIAIPEPINIGIAGARDAFEIAAPHNNLLEITASKPEAPKTLRT